jgi:hypothetical protein
MNELMHEKIVMRQALEALECFADQNVWPVQRSILQLRELLGDDAKAFGSDDPLYPLALQFLYSGNAITMETMLKELRCGYARVAKIMDALVEAGVLQRLNTAPHWVIVRTPELKVANGKN